MTKNAQDAAEAALGAALYATVKALTDAGMRPASALRLAGFVAIDGTLGRGALKALGLPGSTERRWRAEVREAVEGYQLRDDAPMEYLNELLPLMGLDGVEMRRKDAAP